MTVHALQSPPEAEGMSDEKRSFQVEESVCAKAQELQEDQSICENVQALP